jgi:hypothetical protein
MHTQKIHEMSRLRFNGIGDVVNYDFYHKHKIAQPHSSAAVLPLRSKAKMVSWSALLREHVLSKL